MIYNHTHTPYLRVNNLSISVFESFFIHKILLHPKKSKKSGKNPKKTEKSEKIQKIQGFF